MGFSKSLWRWSEGILSDKPILRILFYGTRRIRLSDLNNREGSAPLVSQMSTCVSILGWAELTLELGAQLNKEKLRANRAFLFCEMYLPDNFQSASRFDRMGDN